MVTTTTSTTATHAKLNKLVDESSHIILRVKTLFPFDFFPDEITIDQQKVSIRQAYFFWSSQVRTLEFKDIFNIEVQHNLFFAKIIISDRFFSQAPLEVNYLTKSDALLIQQVIQALQIVTKENIDIRSIPTNQLLDKLKQIGTA